MSTKLSLFALCLALCAAMLACAGGDGPNVTGTKGTDNTATATTSTASAGDSIGIAECDDFLKKYEACVSGKVPAAQQAAFKSSVETWRRSWKDLAANPTTKGTLAGICKTQLDQAKTSLSSYGCSW
ncbi:MAG TPA: hypothetical protein VF736_10290 [Pyrinomonadaceae bacterium]|jgi:hypothetical protein